MNTALIQHAVNILWIAFLCFISIGLGKLTLAKVHMKNSDSGERTIFSAAIGFTIIAYCIFLLGICQILYPLIIYIFTGICAILSLAGWHVSQRRWGKTISPTKAEQHEYGSAIGFPVSTVNRFCLILLIICLLMCMLLVLAPETGKDALVYHIGVPKMFLEHHGIYFIPGNIFASYPFFSEMLYTWGLALRGEILPKGTHFAIAILILFSMWKFGRRYVHENRFEILPLLIFFTIPSVFINAHVAYCDLILTFYTFVTVYAFINWFNTRQTLWLVLCAAFSGVAMSVKYGGLSFPFIGCLGVLWACRTNQISNRKAVHLLLLYVLFTFITGTPFYLKNWIVSGNPLYPFFYQIFGGKGWSADQAAYYDLFLENLGMGRHLLDYLLLPWNLSFKSQMDSPVFDGLMGPVFILVLPFLVGMQKKISVEVKIVMAYSFLAFLFWASSAQQIRYLIPLFPFLAIMVGFVFSHYRKHKILFTLLSTFILWGLVFNGYHMAKDFIKIQPVNLLAGREDKDTFLARNIPSYPMIQYVNAELPENAYILTIYMKNLAYLYKRPFYSDSMFESYTVETILNKAKTPEAVWLALKRKGFTHVLYDINYVLGDASTFSEEEKGLFIDFQNKYLTLVKNGRERYFLYRLLEMRNMPAS